MQNSFDGHIFQLHKPKACSTARNVTVIFTLCGLILSGSGCHRRQAAPVADGAQVFRTRCSACHATGSQTRAPLLESLREMSDKSILMALQSGEMKTQGAKLSHAERVAVANYLADPRTSSMSKGFCRANVDPPLDSPAWQGWGVVPGNTRFQPAATAGLVRSNVAKLKLKWAFGFPGASATYGQPTVFAGRLYAGSEDGTVYSLDADAGCIYWTYQASDTVKTAVSVSSDGRLAYFGDTEGNVYAVATSNGSLVWKLRPESHPAARITGSPMLFGNRLYVPISSGEEGAAEDPKYQCCSFRGSLVALDAESGKQIWKTYMIRNTAAPTRKNALGVQMWGPSGAPIWSSPTVDSRRHVIYVATGNNYSDPPTASSDAVIALSADSGRVLWSKQLTGNDLWNIACVADTKANCPSKPGHDFDFGAPPILQAVAGRDVLLAAQKSGVIYALSPADGSVVWKKRVANGGPLGGIEWGGAVSQRRAYFPLSDWNDADATVGGGLVALDLLTGARVWYVAPARPSCIGKFGCSAAQMAPPTAIPGVVFSGSLDGHLRAYDARNGTVIWDFDAVRDFNTVNGVKAHGGAFNNGGEAVVNGMVYAHAGYTNELDGNLLLAFAPDGR
ncbi:MAG TPA: PQQ-binding-like beta-propeller repeat protein [Terriglobia bacterium]|nr:PQQ-binding-like beta-propeller repeat protein [Terriglobia bacterium]